MALLRHPIRHHRGIRTLGGPRPIRRRGLPRRHLRPLPGPGPQGIQEDLPPQVPLQARRRPRLPRRPRRPLRRRRKARRCRPAIPLRQRGEDPRPPRRGALRPRPVAL